MHNALLLQFCWNWIALRDKFAPVKFAFKNYLYENSNIWIWYNDDDDDDDDR